MILRRYISALLLTLLAILCLPHITVAQDMSVSPDSVYIHMADSLHRTTAVELHKFTAPSEQIKLLKQSEISKEQTDSMPTTAPLQGKEMDGATRRQLRQQRLASFTPDPNKATWSAIVFPGGGQIYNHKYWKLPIVYGGFLGCAYALNWNNQMYGDYSQAYLDIMDDDPGTASYEDFLPPRYNVEANKDYLKRVFKNRKDNYRRQRDLSIFCFIGVYLISVVDAYVDAELSNFDITDDLNVQVRPTTIESRQHTLRNQAYGLQCSFSF